MVDRAVIERRLRAPRAPMLQEAERRYRAGMGLINWIFDLYQHQRIESLRDEVTRSRAEAASVHDARGQVDVARLELSLGELALAVKTLQRMAVEKGLCTQSEFSDKLRAIDLEDGRADNRAPL